MTPTIEAAAYINRSLYKNFAAWDVFHGKKAVRLWENTAFEEIGSLMAQLFRETKKSVKLTPAQTLAAVVENTNLDFACLRFTDGAIDIHSGCCFDFADWRDLFGTVRESRGAWLGHDPTPFIDCLPEQDRIVVWKDEKFLGRAKDSDEKFTVEFSYKQFKSGAANLKNDLENFLMLTELWAEQIDGRLAKSLRDKLRSKFGIFDSTP